MKLEEDLRVEDEKQQELARKEERMKKYHDEQKKKLFEYQQRKGSERDQKMREDRENMNRELMQRKFRLDQNEQTVSFDKNLQLIFI